MIITVTFHCAHNYGAVWQAYALQAYLKSISSDEVECLNYRPSYLNPQLFTINSKDGIFFSIIRNFVAFPTRFLRFVRFNRFIKHNISQTKNSNYIDYDLCNNIFIAGSDQIWNRDITGNKFDDIYFLKPFSKARKYSYAASQGSNDFDSISKNVVLLKSFTKIGVRELSLLRRLEEQGLSNVYLNVDPVFLTDFSFYSKSLRPIKYSRYVLVYTLENNTEVKNRVQELKKSYYTISIGTLKNQYHTNKHYSCASPETFISLIANADYVISNSFHTIAFSVIFGKPFEYIKLMNGRGTRIESLMNILGVEGNVCMDTKDRKNKMDVIISESKEYLKSIINN